MKNKWIDYLTIIFIMIAILLCVVKWYEIKGW